MLSLFLEFMTASLSSLSRLLDTQPMALQSTSSPPLSFSITFTDLRVTNKSQGKSKTGPASTPEICSK
jgi:hypothetical protein